MSVDYQSCYERLEIDSPVNWTDLNSHYRKLVHTWHPDRYTGSNPDIAEKKFIELTKAFSALRKYYNAHHKLPTLITRQSEAHEQIKFQKNIHGEGVFGHDVARSKKQSWLQLTPFARRVVIQGSCFVFVAAALLILFWNMENRNRERLVDKKHIVNSSTESTLSDTGPVFTTSPVGLPAPFEPGNDLLQ